MESVTVKLPVIKNFYGEKPKEFDIDNFPSVFPMSLKEYELENVNKTMEATK